MSSVQIASDAPRKKERKKEGRKEGIIVANIKFVSYNGRYPNLCSGTLVLNIDGTNVTFPKYCLCSGGHIWDEEVGCGPWTINEYKFPEKYQHLESEILEIINDNIPWGCCGGCV